MNRIMRAASNVPGELGAVVCVAAGVARVSGVHYVLEAETISVFQASMGVMVAACLLKLLSLERGMKG